MAPLFAFLSHGGPGACLQLPLFVQTILRWLLHRIQLRRAYPRGVVKAMRGSGLRVDAKAEGSSIGIGGWMPKEKPDGEIDVKTSKWFAFELNEQTAPWAYHEGDSRRLCTHS